MKKKALILILTVFLFLIPVSVLAETSNNSGNGAASGDTTTTETDIPTIKYYRGKVLRVETITIQQDSALGFDEIKQISDIEIEQGPYNGRVYSVENYVKYTDPQKIILQVGDKIMLSAELTEDENEIKSIHIYDYYRINLLLISAIIAIMILLGVSSLKGLRTLVTMTVMFAGLVFYFVPLMLKGYSPILLSIPLCIIVAFINIIWDAGLGVKGFSALLGTLTGLSVSAIAGLIMEKSAKLVGLGESELTMLNYMPNHVTLNYSGLMCATVILISLGAVTDVCIDIVEEMQAAKDANPYITKRKLFLQGFKYGRAYMSRNVNTVFYVLVVLMMPVWILFIGYGTPIIELMNMDVLSIQLFRAFASIIGIVLSMPMTAYLFTAFSKRNSLY